MFAQITFGDRLTHTPVLDHTVMLQNAFETFLSKFRLNQTCENFRDICLPFIVEQNGLDRTANGSLQLFVRPFIASPGTWILSYSVNELTRSYGHRHSPDASANAKFNT